MLITLESVPGTNQY